MELSHAQGELLAQVRPSGTVAVTLYTGLQLRTEATLMIASIISGGAANVDITVWHDDDGTTYDNTTQIFFAQLSKNSDTGKIFQAQHPGSGILIKPGGSIGVRSSVANDVNFSLYGITESIANR